MSLALPSLAPAAPGLAEQLLALRRRWRLILLCTLLAPGLCAVLLARMHPSYTATGSLLYDPANAVIPGDTTGPLAAAQDEAAITASQSAVIASLPAARALAGALHLAAQPAFNPALRRRGPFGLLAPPKPSPDAIDGLVRQAINIDVLPGSRVLTVSFTGTSPAQAAAAVDLLMQNYLTHERDESFAQLTAAQSWLDAHAMDQQAQLDKTETALARARAAAGLVQGAQASLTTETASRLAASLVQAQADMAMNEARLQAASGGDAAAANAAIAPNLLPLRKEQADLTAQVQAMAGEYGANYPNLLSARAQLAAITAAITAETARELDAARAEVAADAAQIAALRSALGAARTQSENQDEQSAPIRALEQRADAGRAMLRAMTLQADQLAQDASLTQPDARILSAATPTSPAAPGTVLILAAALGLGFCAGLLLAGLADALDTSFRSGESVRGQLGLPCLALIPEVPAPQQAALQAPFSLFAEQLRALRTALALGAGPVKIIAITAARPGEGKTTLTIALARALSHAGLRVLAIDGDIRQPSFDAVFQTAGLPGLTDHLAGLLALESAIIQDPLSPLRVLPAGTQAKSALALFLSPALPARLEALRAQYDVILLDVPPAFALAEGRVLARLADRALLCVRWGATPARVVRAAIILLHEAGANVAGVALTRVNPRAHGRSGFADAEMYQPRYGGYFSG